MLIIEVEGGIAVFMDERKRMILQAITDDYIRTAEPIGSRTIARKYNLGISPATIRNEMADLEESGYLEQPHTSAGRVPSSKGYRFYVDSLMELGGLSSTEMEYIYKSFAANETDIEQVIRDTSRLIARMSHYVCLVLGPSIQRSAFRHLQMIPLDELNILVVIVAEPGLVENRIISLSKPISQDELEMISRFLNHTLRGLTIGEISTDLVDTIDRRLRTYRQLFEGVIELLIRSLKKETDARVYFDGAVNLLDHPEFSDLAKAKSLFNLLESEQILYGLLQPSSRGVQIIIGEENDDEQIKDCSLITATYEIGGKTVGTIGILGPTRMEYGRTVSLLKAVVDHLNGFFVKF